MHVCINFSWKILICRIYSMVGYTSIWHALQVIQTWILQILNWNSLLEYSMPILEWFITFSSSSLHEQHATVLVYVSVRIIGFFLAIWWIEEVSVKIDMITVHVSCHVQRLKHCFSFFVDIKYRHATIIHINCTEPEPTKAFLGLIKCGRNVLLSF